MSVEKKITVDELLVTPFSVRSEKEKLRIVSEGRPTPLIKALSILRRKDTAQEGGSQGKRNVYEELKLRRKEMADSSKYMYDDVLWLTASATTQSFYCWPCLLFDLISQPGLWNVSGISDVSRLRTAAEEHQLTKEHVEAMYQYQMFVDSNGKKINRPPVCDKLDVDVIKRLTDVVSTLVSRQLPPKKLKNLPSEIDTKQCISSMQLLRKYDNVDKKSSDKAVGFLKNSPTIIANLMTAIAKVMRQNIAREIESSKYVSMILTRHSNAKLKAQISTFLRYVVNGRVRERFVEFSHLFQDPTVESLFAHVIRIANEFKIETKCIALSIDGAVLPHSDVKKLVQPCQNKLRRCILVPWNSHTVDEVLQKSLSSVNIKFQSFFKIMADFNSCFWDQNSEFCAAYNRFVPKSRINFVNISPRISSNDWFVAPNFISTVQKYRLHFMNFLEEAVSNDSKLSVDDITKARGFREYLDDLVTVFLLDLFSKIFDLTSPLNAALCDISPERIVDEKMVPSLISSLNGFKAATTFARLYACAVKDAGLDAPVRETKCVSLFTEAISLVMGEVAMRYSDVDKFRFCKLFDFEAGGWFEETSSHYKNHYLFCLTQAYNTDYSIPQTQCEMELVSKHKAFSKTSVYDFHQYLHESNFKHAFKALYDFSELILALPFKPSSSAKEMSMKEKIDKWCFGLPGKPCEDGNFEDISILFIERDDLLEMKRSHTFYEQVLANMPKDSLAKDSPPIEGGRTFIVYTLCQKIH